MFHLGDKKISISSNCAIQSAEESIANTNSSYSRIPVLTEL